MSNYFTISKSFLNLDMDVKNGTQKIVHQIRCLLAKVWDAEAMQRWGQPDYFDMTKMYFPVFLKVNDYSRLKFSTGIQAERAASTQSFSPTH